MTLQRRLLPLLLLLLAGCGFQLQGRQTLPESLRTVYLDVEERQSDFASSLRTALTTAGARIVTQPAAGAARITVRSDQVTERVLTVSARNIPTDYELTHEVQVAVDGPDGKSLMAAEEFLQTRIYSFNERRLLAKEREKDLLLAAMARDMTSVVLRRLGAL